MFKRTKVNQLTILHYTSTQLITRYFKNCSNTLSHQERRNCSVADCG